MTRMDKNEMRAMRGMLKSVRFSKWLGIRVLKQRVNVLLKQRF